MAKRRYCYEAWRHGKLLREGCGVTVTGAKRIQTKLSRGGRPVIELYVLGERGAKYQVKQIDPDGNVERV